MQTQYALFFFNILEEPHDPISPATSTQLFYMYYICMASRRYDIITPRQFFPSQEPIFSSQNANIRNMYRGAFSHSTDVNSAATKQYIGKSWDSSGRMNKIKSINVGKFVYTVSDGTPVSTKAYDPSAVRSTLKRVRNN